MNFIYFTILVEVTKVAKNGRLDDFVDRFKILIF